MAATKAPILRLYTLLRLLSGSRPTRLLLQGQLLQRLKIPGIGTNCLRDAAKEPARRCCEMPYHLIYDVQRV
jgi:hypothetical protein